MSCKNNKIEYLRVLVKAVNQAYGNINCDKDLNIDRKEKQQIERELINDENIMKLTKQHVEKSYGRKI